MAPIITYPERFTVTVTATTRWLLWLVASQEAETFFGDRAHKPSGSMDVRRVEDTAGHTLAYEGTVTYERVLDPDCPATLESGS